MATRQGVGSPLAKHGLLMLRPLGYSPPSEIDPLVFDKLLPADPWLRKVLAVVDVDRCRRVIAPSYDAAHGRPSIEIGRASCRERVYVLV